MPLERNEERLARVESAVIQHAEHAREVRQSLGKISEVLVTLAGLEIGHSTTRAGLEKLELKTEKIDSRVAQIEVLLPQLVETRFYLVKAMAAIVGMLGIALAGLVLIK